MKSDCDTCLRMCSNPFPSEWFSRADVDAHYCRIQIIWLITMADILDFNEWPPQSTGYVSVPLNVQTSPPQTSPTQSTLDTWAEVYARLQMTGRDGMALWTEAKKIRDYKEFSQPAKDALNYISGYRRRRMPYKSWLKQRKYRGKIAEKVK